MPETPNTTAPDPDAPGTAPCRCGEIREDIIMDMRRWLGEAVPPINLSMHVEWMDDDEVIAEVARLYPGGTDAFMEEHT